MANVAQSSASALQPTIAALNALIAAVAACATSNGLDVDAGTTNPLYVPMAQLANLLQLTLTTIVDGQSFRTIEVSGGNLYDIAANEYGDITQAFMLMEENDLPTPWLPNTGLTTLVLPPAQTAMASTGITAAQVTP